MSLRDPQPTTGPSQRERRSRRAVILTSYKTGATRGKNLGVPGYSYDIVAQLFVPLLSRWGEVLQVAREAGPLEEAVREARRRGLDPVHVSFLPFQDVRLTPSAPNVIVPAWEFPDVPDHVFDGNPRNNWVATAHQCDLVIVGGQFTVDSFQRAGIRTPIRVVPVPTPDEYFRISAWKADQHVRIPCSAYVFPHPEVARQRPVGRPGADRTGDAAASGASLRGRLRDKARLAYRDYFKPLVPPAMHGLLKVAARRAGRDSWDRYVESCRRPHLDLSGVVYTSIFNPGDGRKNWEDLLTGFLWGLRDCADATLVVKLVTKDRTWIDRILTYYRGLGLAHRCKVVFITDYLKHGAHARSGAGEHLLPDGHSRRGQLLAGHELPGRRSAVRLALPHGHQRLFHRRDGFCRRYAPGAGHLAARQSTALPAPPGAASFGRRWSSRCARATTWPATIGRLTTPGARAVGARCRSGPAPKASGRVCGRPWT